MVCLLLMLCALANAAISLYVGKKELMRELTLLQTEQSAKQSCMNWTSDNYLLIVGGTVILTCILIISKDQELNRLRFEQECRHKDQELNRLRFEQECRHK